jgi:hypothetical protein
MTITIIPYDGLNQVITSIARNPPVSACAGPQAPAAAAAFGRVPPARPAGRGRCLAACSSVGPQRGFPRAPLLDHRADPSGGFRTIVPSTPLCETMFSHLPDPPMVIRRVRLDNRAFVSAGLLLCKAPGHLTAPTG